MMFGYELIESLHFIAPHRPCVQMDENLLFIGCGLAKGGDFFLFHVRQHKKLRPACPAKSFNAFPFSGFPLPKNAPYAKREEDRNLRSLCSSVWRLGMHPLYRELTH